MAKTRLQTSNHGIKRGTALAQCSVRDSPPSNPINVSTVLHFHREPASGLPQRRNREKSSHHVSPRNFSDCTFASTVRLSATFPTNELSIKEERSNEWNVLIVIAIRSRTCQESTASCPEDFFSHGIIVFPFSQTPPAGLHMKYP